MPFRNVWDEICVQVQEEESVLWGAHKDTAEDIIAREGEHLDMPTKKAMWLLSDEYVDWDEDEADDPEEIPWSVEDIARHILHVYVLPPSEGWHFIHVVYLSGFFGGGGESLCRSSKDPSYPAEMGSILPPGYSRRKGSS